MLEEKKIPGACLNQLVEIHQVTAMKVFMN